MRGLSDGAGVCTQVSGMNSSNNITFENWSHLPQTSKDCEIRYFHPRLPEYRWVSQWVVINTPLYQYPCPAVYHLVNWAEINQALPVLYSNTFRNYQTILFTLCQDHFAKSPLLVAACPSFLWNCSLSAVGRNFRMSAAVSLGPLVEDCRNEASSK